MSSASLLCPKCEDGELVWDHYAGSFLDPPEDDFNQDCDCEFTDAELDALAVKAWENYGVEEARRLEDEARWEAENPIVYCPVCGGEPPEHNWETHYAELKA